MQAQTLRAEQKQHQTLTPRLQQAVRLLQLSSLDFAQEVRQAVGNNPFLEEDSETRSPALEAAQQPAAEPEVPSPANPETIEPLEERGLWAGRGEQRLAPSSASGDTDLMDMMAADVSLRQHLHGQTSVMPLSERDRALVGLVIEALDDDGYLRVGLHELAGVAELTPPLDLDELNVALKLVQSLDPSGVGARDVRECLLLQLRQLDDLAERHLACRIVSEQLERLAMRDVPHMAQALGCSVAQVEAVCERIRHLDPRPGWRFGSADTRYVTPDVIVRRGKGGHWIASLNPDVVPKVKLNQAYAELFQKYRDSSHSALAAHLQEARWTLRNVEQRFTTILDVANAIIRHQINFFEYGALAMKPLGLREIAQELGLHESTVSRVTNNKYMSTPLGVFELKYFFSRALPTASGGACSATAIRSVIREMIEAEDAADPVSDAQIARQLARQGLNVARRTVTKYRQMMRLPAVEKRRRHA